MLFYRIEFFLFFAVVYSLFMILKKRTHKRILLLAGSYFFYGFWDWRFLSLILISTTVDFFVSKQLSVEQTEKKRKALLIVSLCVNLGILGFFKYFNFFISSLSALLTPLGFEVQTLQIILPVGISFYTFQTLSYTLDIYFGKLKPTKSFLDYALFVSFFPQLIAGPILRAKEFLPQLKNMRPPGKDDIFKGFVQFTFGLFKKVLIADNLAKITDVVFANPGGFDGATTWIGVIAYAVQIYCDFSGYSDMAIGLAGMMGFHFSKNFDYPYISKRIDEFWKRWHISLSSWLRDYLYIPLGGNRKGKMRTYLNVVITMLLGGLWHGARWNFVVWGLWHGVSLAAVKVLDNRRKPVATANGLSSFLGWLSSIVIVLVGWVLFRVQSMDDALVILKQMFWPQPGVRWINPYFFVLTAFIVASHLLHVLKIDLRERMRPAELASATALCFMWLSTYIFYPSEFTPFIYFQF